VVLCPADHHPCAAPQILPRRWGSMIARAPARMRPSIPDVAWQTLTGRCRRQSPLWAGQPIDKEGQMAAPVVWFEIAGRDLDALSRFYGDLLGWKVDADNPQRYGMVDTGAE